MNKEILVKMVNGGEKEFVFDVKSGRVFTYREILHKSLGVANILHQKGITKGSKVAIILDNSVEFIVIYLANIYLGAVSIPLNPAFIQADFDYIINKCGPDIILTTAKKIDMLKVISTVKDYQMLDIYQLEFDKVIAKELSFELPIIDWSDPIATLFTSGTTGRPKGIVMKYGAVFEHLKIYGHYMKFGEDSRFMQIVQLFHAHGWFYSSIIPALFNSSVILNQPFNMRLAARFWDIVSQYKANILVAVPFVLNTLLELKARTKGSLESKLEYVICGSAFLHTDMKQKFEEVFDTVIYEFYGSTETLYIAFHSPSRVFKEGTVGKLFPQDCNVKIASDGEILLKSKYLFTEYLHEDELTKSVFEDGWYKSGDTGGIDEDGYVFLSGRKKDIINKGGYKVSSKEINDCLLKHPLIVDAATIGLPDQTYGEEIYTFIVVKDQNSISEDEVYQYCKEKLNPAIWPKRVNILEDIPKNAAGKIDKFRLADIFQKV